MARDIESSSDLQNLAELATSDAAVPATPSEPHAAIVPVCALSRRRFVGASAGLALVGCGPKAMPVHKVPAIKQGIVEIEVGKIPELGSAGGIVAVQPEGMRKPLLVLRLEGEQFRVLSSKCTHMGCTVRWDNEEQSLRCPCHGSRFADDGKVTRGPAKAPLTSYAHQLAGTVLQIAIKDS